MAIKKRNNSEEKEDIGARMEEDEKDFSDDFDIIKDVTDVHQQKTFGLNKNFVLMKGGDPKLIEFITKQHLVAIKSYNLLPDKKYARKAYDLITAELDDRAIMKRNEKGNMIITGVFARGMDPASSGLLQERTEKQGIIKRTTNKVKSLIGKGPKTKEQDEVVLG